MRHFTVILLLIAARLGLASPTILMLDPGHTPAFPGAVGARGIEEIQYNDDLVDLVVSKLKAVPEIKVLISRPRNTEIELVDRAQKANQNKIELFLAIHHDSANPKYLLESQVEGRNAFRLSPEFKKKFNVGFSIFVSKKNPKYEQSLKFAECLGRELVALKRPVSDYHTEKLENENRVFINKELGIYQYDELIVLKKTKMPAVLFEAAVISDLEDEAYISKPANREALSNAIVRALKQYIKR